MGPQASWAMAKPASDIWLGPLVRSDAADFVREHAHGITVARGGEGAAREFCELILQAQDRLEAANAAYL